MKSIFKRGLSLLISLILICSLVQGAAAATLNGTGTGFVNKAKRTILFYVCGSDLETESGLASFNIRQILKSNFSADDNGKFIVLTGGSLLWNLESEYLCDPNGLGLSTDEETGEYTVSSEYNQLWEAKGADAAENAGKLVLLDADGITGADGDDLCLKVTHYGETLEEGLDYTWEKKNPNDDLTVPGEYEIVLIGKSKYVRRATKTITVKTGLLGDANLDGVVDITDATTIQRYDIGMIELSDAALTLGDVDGDNDVCIIDATWLQRFDAGMKAPDGIGKPINQ